MGGLRKSNGVNKDIRTLYNTSSKWKSNKYMSEVVRQQASGNNDRVLVNIHFAKVSQRIGVSAITKGYPRMVVGDGGR